MTKDEELSILRDAAQKLGQDSYCGPWLTEQLQFIERDIRGDYPPSPDWVKACTEVNNLVAASRRTMEEEKAAHAKQLLEMNAKATLERTTAHDSLVSAVRQCLKTLTYY